MLRLYIIKQKMPFYAPLIQWTNVVGFFVLFFGCSQSDPAPPHYPQAQTTATQINSNFDDENTSTEDPQSDEEEEDTNRRREPYDEQLALSQSFSETIQPVLTERCGSCHSGKVAPFFAHADAALAASAILQTDKVNFGDPEQSRLYLRLLNDKHNCWSECASNAKTVLGLIKKWQKKGDIESNIEPKDSWILTKALKFSNAKQQAQSPDPQTIILEARTAKLAGGYVVIKDPESNQEVIGTNTPTTPVVAGSPDGTGGTGSNATFDISVPLKGKYTFWISAKNDKNTSDNMSIKIADTLQAFRINPTNDRWMWISSTRESPSINVDLESGNQSITISSRNPIAKISRIAITTRPQLDEIYADGLPRKVLQYDLGKILNKRKTYLEIEISDYSENAYLLRRPKIISNTPLSVKGLRILVNNKYSSRHNTYNLVDVKITPPETILSEAAMLVMKDKGLDLDQLSFAFEELK